MPCECVHASLLDICGRSEYSEYYNFSCPHPIRMAGYSPFQGETNQETFLNVSMVDYSFDDEIFNDVSDLGKDFIQKLLVKTPK